MSFHGESVCQVEGCGLRVISDFKGTWYHDARDLRASGFVPDFEYAQPHEPVPDPDVVRSIAEGKARAQLRALERQRRPEGQDGDHGVDAQR